MLICTKFKETLVLFRFWFSPPLEILLRQRHWTDFSLVSWRWKWLITEGDEIIDRGINASLQCHQVATWIQLQFMCVHTSDGSLCWDWFNFHCKSGHKVRHFHSSTWCFLDFFCFFKPTSNPYGHRGASNCLTRGLTALIPALINRLMPSLI